MSRALPRLSLPLVVVTLVALTLVVSACGDGSPSGTSDAARRLKPGHAPTPYTAGEIREGCPPGRTLTWRVDVEGQEPELRRMKFLDGDRDTVKVVRSRLELDGTSAEEPLETVHPWVELQLTASYPQEDTRISDGEVTVPAGTFDCSIYRVKAPDGSVTTHAFPKGRPGPPVESTKELDGHRVLHMVLLADEMRP